MHLDPIAKAMILGGVCLIVAGIAWQFGWIQALRLGHLPGDIAIDRENAHFYFPITTCIVISLVLSLLAWLFRK